MAWSTENWIQDDTKLSGYPTPAGTAYPEEFSLDGLTSIWHKATSHGYFIPSEDITPFSISGFDSIWHKATSHGYFIPSEDTPAFSIDGFDSIWLFNNNFDGYPHPAELPPAKSGYPVFTAFSMNGIGADFKQISQSRAVSLPEQIQFKFDIKEQMNL